MNLDEELKKTNDLALKFQQVLIPLMTINHSLNVASLGLTFMSLCRCLEVEDKDMKRILQSMMDTYREGFEEKYEK